MKQIQNNDKVNLTDSFKNVTLLFADIVNFTKYSSSVTPNDVVQMLRELFIEFDELFYYGLLVFAWEHLFSKNRVYLFLCYYLLNRNSKMNGTFDVLQRTLRSLAHQNCCLLFEENEFYLNWAFKYSFILFSK